MLCGYVYILCSHKNGTLYTGVTRDIHARMTEHKSKQNPKSFSAKYNSARLVWLERHDLLVEAIAREKAIKNWNRQWKIDLIEANNPNWQALKLEFDD